MISNLYGENSLKNIEKQKNLINKGFFIASVYGKFTSELS